jgi:hypothetical protein
MVGLEAFDRVANARPDAPKDASDPFEAAGEVGAATTAGAGAMVSETIPALATHVSVPNQVTRYSSARWHGAVDG